MRTAKQLLKNYLADIQYLYDYNGGYLGVNEMSCGTPEFQSDSEYQAYVNNLKKVIEATPNTFGFIGSADPETEESLYWSNEYGWTDKDSMSLFCEFTYSPMGAKAMICLDTQTITAL